MTAEDQLAGVYPRLTFAAGVGRPFVAVSMVSSVDGASSLAGLSGKLGGPADRVALSRLRDAADTILVGARTVVAEDYGPAVPSLKRQRERERRGLPPAPRLVIYSRTLRLVPSARVFSDPGHRPLIVTTERSATARGDQFTEVADVVALHDSPAPGALLLQALHERGCQRVLCEGGPGLNGMLLAEDLIDELFVTLAPQVVGGSSPRIVHRPDVEGARALQLVSTLVVGDELLVRYRRRLTDDT